MPTALFFLAALACQPQAVEIEVLPATPLLERQRSHLSLQCDFLLRNEQSASVNIIEIVLNELDADGALMRRRSVNRNGTAPSLFTLRKSAIPGGGFVQLFNPFHHFELGAAPAWLEFEFTLQSSGAPWTETLSIEGQVYETRTKLRLPMTGQILVKDGHDYLSHHRRLGLDHPGIQAAGLEANSGRYAIDLVVIDDEGAETKGIPRGPQDWYCWDAEVVAPGDGRVILAVNDFPDNRIQGGRVIQHPRVTTQDITTFAGNVVVIDHGNGEFSCLGHLRQGSVVVEVGQEVKSGDLLGTIGLSGSTGAEAHLHYQLQDSASLGSSVGLPAAFTRYRLSRGSEQLEVTDAPVDTGDIVQHF
jgi:hypothetical protein